MFKFVRPAFLLMFLLGVASIATFDTILFYQASNCSYQKQGDRTAGPNDKNPPLAQKPDDGGHEQKQKAVSEPFACSIAGLPAAIRQFMNHNEGFFVGGFTFMLVFVTAWLVSATLKLWKAGEDQRRSSEMIAERQRRSSERIANRQLLSMRNANQATYAGVKAAQASADAAMLSARAAIALELPIIRIALHGFSFGSSQRPTDRQYEWCVLNALRFSNLGRTKAFPIQIRCGWTVGERLPDEPIYTFTKQFRIGLIFDPDPKITPQLHVNEFVCEQPVGFHKSIRDDNQRLWFYCSLSYLDFMQNRHEAGFCWRRYEAAGTGDFIEDDKASYNRKT